jgi:S-adenosylmethionine:tRNA ribosyltransferase-isomerase
VGPGTFLPVRPEHAADVRGHAMHGEQYEIPPKTPELVRQTRAQGRRVVAVGTTSLRALETWWAQGESSGVSRLFVTPGYRFGCVDALLTNFHLPKSTLLMLVSAMAGRERMLAAYAEALAQKYRFFSFGDAMLIIDPSQGLP